MIESPMGRRWALAGSTFITAFFCVIFAMVQSSWAIRASTVGISLSATVRALVVSMPSYCADDNGSFRQCGLYYTGE